jgi:hypothetical protein
VEELINHLIQDFLPSDDIQTTLSPRLLYLILAIEVVEVEGIEVTSIVLNVGRMGTIRIGLQHAWFPEQNC